MKYLLCSLTATAVGTTLLLLLLFPQSNYDVNVSPVHDLLWSFALLDTALLVVLLYPRRTHYKDVRPVRRARFGGQAQGMMKLDRKDTAVEADRLATASHTRAIIHVESTVYVLGTWGFRWTRTRY